jgi:hypothetical protein
VQQHGGVFAAGEEQDGPFTFGRNFAEDENGVGFEKVEVVSHKKSSHRKLRYGNNILYFH